MNNTVLENSNIYGYARVSTKEQKLDRQINALKCYVKNENNIISDKLSGKDFNRINWIKLRSLLKPNDILVIKELDRLGRNQKEMLKEWKYLVKNNINIIIMDMNILSTVNYINGIVVQKSKIEIDLIQPLVLQLLSYFSELERNKIRERQKEGIANIKNKGVHLGKPWIKITLEKQIIIESWSKKEINSKDAIELLQVSPSTAYRLLKEYETTGFNKLRF